MIHPPQHWIAKLIVCVLLAIVGIAGASLAFRQTTSSAQTMAIRSSPPPWEYAGAYNVSPAELGDRGDETWVCRADLPRLSEDEFETTRQAICKVFLALGLAKNEWAQGDQIFVWDDNYFDRTIRVEYSAEIGRRRDFAAVIKAIQKSLEPLSHWRVLLTSAEPESAIWIYSHEVRTSLDSQKLTEQERLVQAGKRAE